MTLNKLLGIIFFLYLPLISLAAQQQYAHAPIQITQSINKAFDLHRSQPDSALQIAEQALVLAEIVRDTQSLINLWRIKGLVHYRQHNMEKTLVCFEQAYAFANQINYRKSRLLINLGNTYYQQQAYELATQKYEQALEFNTKRDTLLSIDALNNLGSVCISTGKFEDAIEYYQKSLILQKAIDKLQIPTYINMAQTYNRLNQFDKGIATYEIAKELAQSRKDTTLLVISYRRIGSAYRKKGAYAQSIHIFQKILDLQKLTNNQREVAKTLQSIALVFYEQKDHEASLTYLNQALTISVAENNYRHQATVLNRIGKNYTEQLLHLQALTAFQKAKKLYEQEGLKKSLMYSIFGIGNTYERLNHLDSAILYLNQAKHLAEFYNQNDLKADIQISMGKVALKRERHQVALTHFRQALGLAKREGLIKREVETSKLLADLLKKQNNDREALFYLERHLALKDTLFNVESTKKITQIEASYKFEKEKQDLIYQNEAEKKTLDNEIQRQRTWQIILGLALFLSLLALFFYSRYQRLNTKINTQRLQFEQKERERLEEMDTFKSRFFTNITHELRTPLTLILAPIQRLLKNNTHQRENQSMLQLIQDNAQQLLVRVNEILDLSKIEAKKMELKEQPTLLHDFIKKLVANFEGYAQLKSQKLIVDYQFNPLLTVLLDQSNFRHIFHNYLSNALKFTPEGGQIEVKLIGDNNIAENEVHVVLEVKDNGIGIAAEDLPHIFDRFYQVRGNVTNYSGTGVGLALTKEITKLMNGQVDVKSKRGKGSTFYCSLPLKIAPKIATVDMTEVEGVEIPITTPNSPKTQPSNTASTSTILVVEDNAQLNAYLQLIFKEQYRVLSAKNGKEALNKLAIHDCQLIISDIMMPEMDGFELLNQLKSSEKYCHLPIIMLTAKGGIQDKLKALRIGVDDYIIKPFVETELLVRVQNLLNNRQNRQVEELAIPNKPITEIPTTSKSDLLWLEEVEDLLKKEMSNSQFTFDQLANQLFISRSQLQRRIKKITGLTPNKYFREIRLQTARDILESGKARTTSEVAHAVGFDTPKYFVKIYQERFGKHPKVDL